MADSFARHLFKSSRTLSKYDVCGRGVLKEGTSGSVAHLQALGVEFTAQPVSNEPSSSSVSSVFARADLGISKSSIFGFLELDGFIQGVGDRLGLVFGVLLLDLRDLGREAPALGLPAAGEPEGQAEDQRGDMRVFHRTNPGALPSRSRAAAMALATSVFFIIRPTLRRISWLVDRFFRVWDGRRWPLLPLASSLICLLQAREALPVQRPAQRLAILRFAGTAGVHQAVGAHGMMLMSTQRRSLGSRKNRLQARRP